MVSGLVFIYLLIFIYLLFFWGGVPAVRVTIFYGGMLGFRVRGGVPGWKVGAWGPKP